MENHPWFFGISPVQNLPGGIRRVAHTKSYWKWHSRNSGFSHENSMVDLSSSFFVNVYQRVYPMMFPLFCSLFFFMLFICFFSACSQVFPYCFPIFPYIFPIFPYIFPIFPYIFPIFPYVCPTFSGDFGLAPARTTRTRRRRGLVVPAAWQRQRDVGKRSA